MALVCSLAVLVSSTFVVEMVGRLCCARLESQLCDRDAALLGYPRGQLRGNQGNKDSGTNLVII